MSLSTDVLIVGGGQAGLAAGYHLKSTRLKTAILDGSSRVGDSWRQRYDSLTLFTPRQFSALPGMQLEGDPEGYASKDEFADYLEKYARTFELPVRTRALATRLSLRNGTFDVETDTGERYDAANVVVATGAFQAPVVPSLSTQFSKAVGQYPVNQYRNPAQLPIGPVLVVGDGASGRDIAAELAPTRKTYLAGGRQRRLLPERLFGRSIWWWLDRLGLMRAGPHSMVGRIIRRSDPFPDRNRSDEALRKVGVTLTGRLTGASQAAAKFADGSQYEVATVVWAVGYRDQTSWIAVPGATDPNGRIVHTAGVSPVNGLYFLGRPWQRNRASALIMGAGADAQRVIDGIVHTERKPPNSGA